MYSHNDTLNSIQNSTINITQLMTTTTTSNRRSRFVKPSQTNPAPEDEDIYVSLQVLQAQLNTRSAPPGSQELLERVLSKVDKLQTTVNAFSENYQFVRRDGENDSVSLGGKRNRFASHHGPLQKHTSDHNQTSKHEIQELILRETIAEKDIQITGLQSEYQVAQKEIKELQSEVQATRIQYTESHEKAIFELHKHIEALEIRVREHDTLQEQINALNARLDQHDKHANEIRDLQQTVNLLQSTQQQSNTLMDKYKIEQDQNNQLLKRNWVLEVENSKLKKAVTKMIQTREESEMDTILFPNSDNLLHIRAMLEQEQAEKMGHAWREHLQNTDLNSEPEHEAFDVRSDKLSQAGN